MFKSSFSWVNDKLKLHSLCSSVSFHKLLTCSISRLYWTLFLAYSLVSIDLPIPYCVINVAIRGRFEYSSFGGKFKIADPTTPLSFTHEYEHPGLIYLLPATSAYG